MPTIYNFSAGPAMLPASILREVQSELCDWQGLGVSVMEMGHRTTAFQALMAEAEEALRQLLAIPDHYHVLFLGGAARTQFAMAPMNLLGPDEKAGYVISGVWSSMAYDEARRLKQAYCVATTVDSNFTQIPIYDDGALQSNTRYLYFTPNETVNGVRFPSLPHHKGIPLVADMTSCLLTEPINVDDYGLIFAGAQKNIAPAGLTIVIVRDDLLGKMPEPVIPTMLDYRIHAAHHSSYATPPTFNCYMAAKMFKWVAAQGGVNQLYQLNQQKAEKLYAFIDASPIYEATVSVEARSIVNVCFRLQRPELESLCIQQAEQQGLMGLKGHRLAGGGLRASLYNAMPMAGVDALIAYLKAFAREYA